ncbi:MAG: hypothetical protein ACC660_07630, partial [Acidimicrobiales bacterium]
LSGPGWSRDPARVAREWRDLRRRFRTRLSDRENPIPLLGLLVLSTVVSTRILRIAYGTSSDGGISVGHLSTFGDWSAHLAYVASFANADNWPPELPTAAGESFAYHFGVDWFAAMFVPLGLSVQGSLQVSSAILAIAFPGIMYVATLRFVQSRLASVIAVLVFLMAGGTAALWRFFFEDLPDNGIGVLGNLPRSYAFDGFDRNWLDNPVTGFLYPQRPTLIGFAAVLMGLALLWQNRERHDTRTYLFVGLLTGIMPIFHVFAFGVLMVMGLTWALLDRVRAWLWFLVPALVLGAPIVLWQLPADGAAGRDFPHLGWVLGRSSWEQNLPDFIWFWALNTGVFIPLVVVGLIRRRDLTLRFLPIFGLLLIANIGIWHFWVGNNAKYVVFFLLLGAPFLGACLASWIRSGTFRAVGACVLIFTLVISGGLDIWRAFEGSSGAYPAAYLSGDDVLVGEWVRDHTQQSAVFAAANSNVHSVRAIAGRTVVSGAPGRLNDLGVNWLEREQDLRIIYGVNEGFDRVIEKYEIDYVVLGPEERRLFRPADAPDDWDPAQFWDAAAPIVYDIGGYKVYDVRGLRS